MPVLDARPLVFAAAGIAACGGATSAQPQGQGVERRTPAATPCPERATAEPPEPSPLDRPLGPGHLGRSDVSVDELRGMSERVELLELVAQGDRYAGRLVTTRGWIGCNRTVGTTGSSRTPRYLVSMVVAPDPTEGEGCANAPTPNELLVGDGSNEECHEVSVAPSTPSCHPLAFGAQYEVTGWMLRGALLALEAWTELGRKAHLP
jgi:hypothetical protein